MFEDVLSTGSGSGDGGLHRWGGGPWCGVGAFEYFYGDGVTLVSLALIVDVAESAAQAVVEDGAGAEG